MAFHNKDKMTLFARGKSTFFQISFFWTIRPLVERETNGRFYDSNRQKPNNADTDTPCTLRDWLCGCFTFIMFFPSSSFVPIAKREDDGNSRDRFSADPDTGM
jgi:hypothetical protein